MRTFHLFAALAEFEGNLLKERTLAGLAAARARGRLGGRPKKLNTSQVEQLKALHSDKVLNPRKPSSEGRLKSQIMRGVRTSEASLIWQRWGSCICVYS